MHALMDFAFHYFIDLFNFLHSTSISQKWMDTTQPIEKDEGLDMHGTISIETFFIKSKNHHHFSHPEKLASSHFNFGVNTLESFLNFFLRVVFL